MATHGSVNPDSRTGKPSRPRRWIPLSLRLFLAILLLAGVGSALWIGVPAYRQHAAIIEVERLGGSIDRAFLPIARCGVHSGSDFIVRGIVQYGELLPRVQPQSAASAFGHGNFRVSKARELVFQAIFAGDVPCE